MKINSFGWTYVGRREQNQDSILLLEIDKTRNIYFYAVADGMGGMGGGEVASEIVTRICKNYLEEIFKIHENLKLKEILNEVIIEIDNEILRTTEEDKSLSGMGSTLTCLLIAGKNYVVGNVGDSRTYILDGKNIHQLSVDHSYIEEYKQKYNGQVDEAIQKKYGHIVTKSLSGVHDEPDIFPKEKDSYLLGEGTAFMLCSDGLLVNKNNNTTGNFIHKVCIGTKNPKEAVEYLIKLAYHSGSTDNISVIFVEIGELARKKKADLPKSFFVDQVVSKVKLKPVKRLKVINFAFIIVILAGILFIGYKILPTKSYINREYNIGKSELETPDTSKTYNKIQKLEFVKIDVGDEINIDVGRISWEFSGGKNLEYTLQIEKDNSIVITYETEMIEIEINKVFDKDKDIKRGEKYNFIINANSSDGQTEQGIKKNVLLK